MNKMIAAAGVLALFSATAQAAPVDVRNVPFGATVEAAPVANYDDFKIDAETITFPATGDTSSVASGTNYWNEGDNVTGTRSLTEAADSVVATIFISDNVLSCDTQDHVVTIDGQVIGTFSVSAGDTVVELSADFPEIGAGRHTFAITTTATVDSGCGSANFTFDVSTWDFDGGGSTGGCNPQGALPLGASIPMSLALLLGLGLRRRED